MPGVKTEALCIILSNVFTTSVLEDEDVVFLVRNTAFSESDIREWWR